MGIFNWFTRRGAVTTPVSTPKLEETPLPVIGDVIFLDIDGVLHPGCSETLKYMPNLYRVLDEYQSYNIVICSNWRETASFDYLKSLFNVSYRHRVLGVTPSLKSGNSQNRRGREIATFLDRNPGIQNWFVLDDEPMRYNLLNPQRIFVTKTMTALDNDTTQQLLEWIGPNSLGQLTFSEREQLMSGGRDH